jgi:hypothetical protein
MANLASFLFLRLSYKAFPDEPSRHYGMISEEEKVRVAAMSVAALLAEVAGGGAAASKRAAAAAVAGGAPVYHGVGWHKNRQKYRARLQLKGKMLFCGCHVDAKDAAKAYDAAAYKAFHACAP